MTTRTSVDRGRGRASPSTRGGPASPIVNLGRGRSLTPVRGGDRGGGRGFQARGGPQRERGRGGIFMHGQPANIDPRIADNSDKALVASFPASDPDRLPFRPNFGTDGKEIELRTNFFPVRVPAGTTLYVYHVTFTPSFLPFRVKERVYDLAARTTPWIQAGMGLPGRIAHDGNRLVSVYPLPQPLTISVLYYDEAEGGPPRQGGKTYTLTIIFNQNVDTWTLACYLTGQMQHRKYNPSPAIAALSLVLMSLPKKMGITTGRNRYFSRRVAEPFRLGNGVEAWKGIHASVQPTYKQLMINADICTTAFYTPGNLAHAMNSLRDLFSGARMNRLFSRARIKVTHLEHHKVVKKFSSLTARTCSLETTEYGRVTMEEYLKQKYNIHLEYPDLQLVEVGMQTENCLPAELCEILPGQPYRRMLASQQAAVMSTIAQLPNIRGQMIVDQVHHHLGLNLIRPELESFGITIGPDMAVIPGRILSKPGITYASSSASISDRASWNLIGVKFVVGARLDNWAVLAIEDGAPGFEFAGSRDGDLRDAVSAFRHMCNASGMQIISDPTYATAELSLKQPSDPLRLAAIQTIKSTLLNFKPKPALVLIILANCDRTIYDGVKHLCDVHLDVATVCVQSAKIRKQNPHYLASVALKLNMKLGGVNHKLEGSGREWLNGLLTMVVGMDVMHPNLWSPVGCPSIAAVVASVDRDFAQYPALLEIQTSKGKMITNLRDIMIDRLKLFRKKNDGNLPDRILIYRKGVAESQFNGVGQSERAQIIEAFKAFSSGAAYKPKLTIVICRKSRHVRFFPTKQDNTTDGNPLPGTVVDRGITSIYNFDFFLQSHASEPQGGSHPTHYCVIYDENGFRADEIQEVTNALSYMFVPATQAMRMVSPVYYANTACQRGRCYLRELACKEGATEQSVMEEAQRLWRWGVAGAGLKDTMFYI